MLNVSSIQRINNQLEADPEGPQIEVLFTDDEVSGGLNYRARSFDFKPVLGAKKMDLFFSVEVEIGTRWFPMLPNVRTGANTSDYVATTGEDAGKTIDKAEAFDENNELKAGYSTSWDYVFLTTNLTTANGGGDVLGLLQALDPLCRKFMIMKIEQIFATIRDLSNE